MKRKNKYGNVKTVVDGITFDSKLEARRWRQLKFMEFAGEISNLERQVVFPLVINDVKVASMRPDFVYSNKSGVKVIEDAKSVITAKNPVYRLKKKLIKAIYDIDIIEIYR